jgi:uncharacterized Zn-finger protein
MNTNPWQVDSIEAFSCLKCPECNFYSRDENYFQNHAMANHPCSVVFFGKHEEYIAMTPEEYQKKFNKQSNLDETSSCQIKVEIKQEIVENESKLNDSELVDESYENLNGQEETFENDPSDFNHDIDLEDIDLKSKSETTIIRNQPYRCSLCNKGYAQKKWLIKHFKTVHGENSIQFKCSICDAKFPEMQTLIEHNASVHEKLVDESIDQFDMQDPFKDSIDYSEISGKVHEAKMLFNCEICVETFMVEETLKYHMIHEHKNINLKEPTVCSLCNMTFSTSGSLNRHIQAVHEGIKPYKCDICQATFTQKTTLKDHISCIHEGKKPFHCSKCDKTFAQRSNMIRHYETRHEEKPKAVKPKPSVHEKLVNESIDQFDMQDSLKDSEISGKVHEGKKLFNCEICLETFVAEETLKYHMIHEHKIINIKEPIICLLCNMTFGKSGSLNRHIQTVHEGIKPYKCDICQATFTQKTTLRDHISCIHEGKKPFQCSKCDKTFAQRSNMIRHYEARHEENKPKVIKPKPHNCPECDSSFAIRKNMFTHLRSVHEKKKPYKCPKCPKSFSEKQKVNRHILSVHEGQRPFACTLCEMTFAANQSLKNHVTVFHDGKKPYSCHICSESFTTNERVRTHIFQDHEMEKPHKCLQCEASFALKQSLARHIARVHDN